MVVGVDHAAGAPLVEKGVDAHAHEGAVGEVEGYRGMAADFVADFNRTALHFETESFDFALEEVVEDVSLGDLAKFGMAVVVVAEMDAGVFDFLIGEAVEDTFGNHGCAIVDAHDFAFDDAAYNEVDNLVDGDFGLVEEFGDDDHGIVACTGDAEGEMACGTTHGRDDEPVFGGAGIFHDSGADDGTLGFGAIVAEGGRAVGQREVVVDGLGDVDVGNWVVLAFEEFGDAVGRRSGIVATDGNKQFDVVIGKEWEVKTLFEVLVGRFEAAHFEDAATFIEDFVGGEEIEVLHTGFVGEKGAVAAVETDDAIAVAEEGFGDRSDHSVHSGGGTTACEDCYTFHDTVVFIGLIFWVDYFLEFVGGEYNLEWVSTGADVGVLYLCMGTDDVLCQHSALVAVEGFLNIVAKGLEGFLC